MDREKYRQYREEFRVHCNEEWAKGHASFCFEEWLIAKLEKENGELKLELSGAKIARLKVLEDLDMMQQQRDAARKVAVSAFNNLGWFNWQTWTLHQDQIQKWMDVTRKIVEGWDKRCLD